MPNRSPLSLLRDRKLCIEYARAANFRSPRSRIPKPPDALVQDVSDWLGDSRLVDLFIESQFAAMPVSWCLGKFKRNYPPANVVFGGDCKERYKKYIDSGNRVPTTES